MADALRHEEEAMFSMLWIMYGGTINGLVREVKKGVQSVKVVGTAFIVNGQGLVKVTGLRGHLHPCKNGGQKAIHIESIRVDGSWIQDRGLIRADCGFCTNGFGPYVVLWI